MTLASRLHVPLDVCKRETTYYDLIGWLEFFRQEDEKELQHVSKQDFYLAQIAAEVRRTIAKNPMAVRVQSLLLHIQSAKRPTNMTKEERTRISKMYWLHAIPQRGAVGYKVQQHQKKG